MTVMVPFPLDGKYMSSPLNTAKSGYTSGVQSAGTCQITLPVPLMISTVLLEPSGNVIVTLPLNGMSLSAVTFIWISTSESGYVVTFETLTYVGIGITVTSNGLAEVGGLFGETQNTEITKVSLISDTNIPIYIEVVSQTEDVYAGGFVGKLVYSTISRCYIQGTKDYINRVAAVSAAKGAYVGGLVGLNNGFVNNSYVRYAYVDSTATTVGYAGGIAGKCFNDSSSYSLGKIEYCYIASFMTSDNDIALQDAIKVTSSTANTKVFAGGITGDSEGCSIARCFAYTGVTVDLHLGNKSYSFGYISGHRNTSSSIDNSYTDIESKNGTYPMVAMKVVATTGVTYTYNYDDEFVFNIELNGAQNTNGKESFRSGLFMNTTAGWNNEIWNLANGTPIVYVEGELPALRA